MPCMSASVSCICARMYACSCCTIRNPRRPTGPGESGAPWGRQGQGLAGDGREPDGKRLKARIIMMGRSSLTLFFWACSVNAQNSSNNYQIKIFQKFTKINRKLTKCMGIVKHRCLKTNRAISAQFCNCPVISSKFRWGPRNRKIRNFGMICLIFQNTSLRPPLPTINI